MSTRHHRVVAVLMVVGAIGAICVVSLGEGGVSAGAPDADVPTPGAPSSRGGVAASQAADPGSADASRRAAGLAFVVADAVTQQVLPQATLTLMPPRDDVHTLAGPPDYQADDRGTIVLAGTVDAEQILLFRAPGHVPKAFHGGESSSGHVHLAPAAALTVRVIDTEGKPVGDATVALTVDGTTGFLAILDPVQSGIGHPLAARPRWIRPVDGLGVARMDELPPARYFLNVLAKDCFVRDEVGANGEIVLGVGERDITVVVEQPYGVVFQTPSPSPVANVTWEVAKEDLDRSPQILARIGALHQAVVDRFPGCLVYVHSPRDRAKQVHVDCFASLLDTTLWHGRWPLTPIAEWRQPVFLEQVLLPTRVTTIHVRDPAGNELPRIPLRLNPRGKGIGLVATSGVPLAVPHGEYQVVCGYYDPELVAAFRKVFLTVGETSAAELVVTTADTLREVLVEVVYPSREVLAPLTIRLGDGRVFGSAVANWRPSRGAIRRFVRGERVSVEVRSVAYEDVDIVQAVALQGPTRVEVRLREKRPERAGR